MFSRRSGSAVLMTQRLFRGIRHGVNMRGPTHVGAHPGGLTLATHIHFSACHVVALATRAPWGPWTAPLPSGCHAMVPVTPAISWGAPRTSAAAVKREWRMPEPRRRTGTQTFGLAAYLFLGRVPPHVRCEL